MNNPNDIFSTQRKIRKSHGVHLDGLLECMKLIYEIVHYDKTKYNKDENAKFSTDSMQKLEIILSKIKH